MGGKYRYDLWCSSDSSRSPEFGDILKCDAGRGMTEISPEDVCPYIDNWAYGLSLILNGPRLFRYEWFSIKPTFHHVYCLFVYFLQFVALNVLKCLIEAQKLQKTQKSPYFSSRFCSGTRHLNYVFYYILHLIGLEFSEFVLRKISQLFMNSIFERMFVRRFMCN